MLKIKAVYLITLSILLSSPIIAQTTNQAMIDAAAQRAAEERQRQVDLANTKRREQEFDRLRAISNGLYTTDETLIRNGKNVKVRYSPKYTERDIRAIAVPDELLKSNAAFLRGNGTGIRRLQDTAVCDPNKLIITAATECPDNVVAKATSFSFRTDSFRQTALADIVLKGGELYVGSTLTLGVLVDIGESKIADLDLRRAGISDLLEMKAPDSQDEVERENSILKKGLDSGGYKFSSSASAVVGHAYALRSIAYNGELQSGKRTVKMASLDKRGDVTIVFTVIQKLDDGSIGILWKKISEAAPPKVVLKAH